MSQLSLKRVYKRYWTGIFDTTTQYREVYRVVNRNNSNIGLGPQHTDCFLWYTSPDSPDTLKILDITKLQVVNVVSTKEIAGTADRNLQLKFASGRFSGRKYQLVCADRRSQGDRFVVHVFTPDGSEKLKSISFAAGANSSNEYIDYFSTTDDLAVAKVSTPSGAILVLIDLVTSNVSVANTNKGLYGVVVQPTDRPRECLIWAEDYKSDKQLLAWRYKPENGIQDEPMHTPLKFDSTTETSAITRSYQVRRTEKSTVWIVNNIREQILRVQTGILFIALRAIANGKIVIFQAYGSGSGRALMVNRSPLTGLIKPRLLAINLPKFSTIQGISCGYVIGYVSADTSIVLYSNQLTTGR